MQERGLAGVRQGLCTGCKRCTDVCPTRAITVSYGKAHIDPTSCIGCSRCVAVCQAGAILMLPESIRATMIRLQRLGRQIQMLSDAVNKAVERKYQVK